MPVCFDESPKKLLITTLVWSSKETLQKTLRPILEPRLSERGSMRSRRDLPHGQATLSFSP